MVTCWRIVISFLFNPLYSEMCMSCTYLPWQTMNEMSEALGLAILGEAKMNCSSSLFSVKNFEHFLWSRYSGYNSKKQ